MATPPVVPSPPVPAPNPSTQEEPQFNLSAQAQADYFLPMSNGINAASIFVNDRATATEAAAISAESSASLAAGAANFKGNWSDLTGALAVPASVQHNSKLWLLLVSLPDVTTSEPASGNSNWLDATPLVNPFTTDNQIILSGAGGTIQVLGAPGDDTGIYSLTYDSATQTMEWGVGAGGGAAGADIDAIDLGSVGAGSATLNIDMALGSVFTIDMSGADTAGTLTLTASNIPADGFNIHLAVRRAGRKSISFPAGWGWNQNITPTLANGATEYTLVNVQRLPFFSATGASLTVVTEQVNK